MIVRLDYKCHAFISSHRLHGHEQYWYLCVVEGRQVVVSILYTHIIASFFFDQVVDFHWASELVKLTEKGFM